jgi:ectonucleotide pyrophosphatase/phosphodiesterase family protein 5
MQLSLLVIVFLALALAEAKPNPVLLISFDGTRADKFNSFLAKNPSSNFARFARTSSRASYMKPSFPSSTFPNHWTLVTGLYPESHGIVGNSVYDPIADINMRLAKSDDVFWWNYTEPIWLSARKQGLKTASSFWVGNDVYPRNPDIFLDYSPNYDLRDRVDELAEWFHKFDLDFACMYFDEPDKTGHVFGPDSEEYMTKVLHSLAFKKFKLFPLALK